MKKFLCAILSFIMLISAFSLCCFADESVVANGIVEISKYGNVKINLPHSVVAAHFELGDILTVSFGDVSVDVPLCISFSDVDSGNAGIFCQVSGDVEETELAINMGNFAEAYGLADKIVYPDKTYEWVYKNGFSKSTQFTVVLKEKAGYLEEFTNRNLVYTDAREDFPHLTDAEFCNFRMVTAGDIKQGVLYRSASPVDPTRNRNAYADKESKANGITHFINLGDSEMTLNGYEGYSSSYYATVNHIAVEASMDPVAEENKVKYAQCFRYIIENPNGKFDVHCREGKERTGMFIAITECLMGATYDEIVNDYMVTFVNYFGIKESDAIYSTVVNNNFRKTLTKVFDADPKNSDLVKEAEEYLKDIGLSYGEIISLKKVLSGKNTFGVLLSSVQAHLNWFFGMIVQFFKTVMFDKAA